MVGVAERFVIPDDLARAAAKERRGDRLAGLPALVVQIAADRQIEVGDPFFPGGATAWMALARDHAGKDCPSPARITAVSGRVMLAQADGRGSASAECATMPR
jgi:hypothetical protein